MLENHQLYLTVLSDLKLWLPNKKLDVNILKTTIDDKSLSPKARYEINSFYRCEMLDTVLARLDKTSKMVKRRFYKQKGDNKRDVAIEHHISQYHMYCAYYQSGLDVSLRLVNAILDLNYPLNLNLRFKVCNSGYVKKTKLGKVLLDLEKQTNAYREIKNLLLHEGKGSRPPISLQRPSEKEIRRFSKEYGYKRDVVVSGLEHIYTVFDSNKLVETMDKERNDLELTFRRLMDELLPHYICIHRQF